MAKTSDIQMLFQELSRSNDEHQDSSYLRRGLQMVGPLFKGISVMLTVADPVASIEPSAASAVAIVKLVALVGSAFIGSNARAVMADAVQIGTAICGAEESLRTSIEELLQHLPRIDSCDALQLASPARLVHTVGLPDFSSTMLARH